MKSGLFAVLLGGVLAVSVNSECVDTDETVPEGQRDCSFVESLGQESIKIRYCALTDAATFLKQREMCCVCGGGRTITTTPATTTVTTITTTTTEAVAYLNASGVIVTSPFGAFEATPLSELIDFSAAVPLDHIEYNTPEASGTVCGGKEVTFRETTLRVEPPYSALLTTDDTRGEPDITFQCNAGSVYLVVMYDFSFGFAHGQYYNVPCNESGYANTMVNSISFTGGLLNPGNPFESYGTYVFAAYEKTDGIWAADGQELGVAGEATYASVLEAYGVAGNKPVAGAWMQVRNGLQSAAVLGGFTGESPDSPFYSLYVLACAGVDIVVTEPTTTTETTTIAACEDTDTNIVGTQNCAWIEGQKDLEALLPGWIEDLCTGKVYDNGFKAAEMCCVCAAFSAADGSGSVGRSGSGSEGDDDDDIREPQETTTLPVSEELTVAPTQEPTALPSSTEAEEESKKFTKGEKIGLGLGLSFGLLILIMVLFTPHRSEAAEFEVPQPAAEEVELKSVKVAEPILVLEPDFFSKKILKKTKSTSV